MTNVLVPSWGFLYINCKKRNGTSCTGMFSSPRGDFFILTIVALLYANGCAFSSPRGDFFILTMEII